MAGADPDVAGAAAARPAPRGGGPAEAVGEEDEEEDAASLGDDWADGLVTGRPPGPRGAARRRGEPGSEGIEPSEAARPAANRADELMDLLGVIERLQPGSEEYDAALERGRAQIGCSADAARAELGRARRSASAAS